MSNLMRPVTVNEIEFYVSDTGDNIGISISGLAILCGVARQTIQDLLDRLAHAGTKGVESLKSLYGKDLYLQEESLRNAKILTCDTASKIISYYALESKAANNIAKYSLMKFVNIGFETWVKEITGYKETKQSTTEELLEKLLLKFDGLERETKELRTIRGKTKTVYVGLDAMLDTLAEEESLLPSESTEELEKTYTLTEWLREFKGIYDLSNGKKHSLALTISQTYNQLKDEKPKREIRRSKDGKINNGVSVYTLKDFWILEKSFSLVMLK